MILGYPERVKDYRLWGRELGVLKSQLAGTWSFMNLKCCVKLSQKLPEELEEQVNEENT